MRLFHSLVERYFNPPERYAAVLGLAEPAIFGAFSVARFFPGQALVATLPFGVAIAKRNADRFTSKLVKKSATSEQNFSRNRCTKNANLFPKRNFESISKVKQGEEEDFALV